MFNADSVFEFSLNRFIKFGVGAVKEIGYEVKKFGGSRVLIVTDMGVKKAGLLKEITEPLEHEGISYELFDKVVPEPSDADFMECISYARKKDYDLIIGLGGGSAVDVAKTAGIVLKHGGELMDYIAPPTGRGKPIPGPGVPVIGCPTTAGTGTEVSPVTAISLKEKKIKVGISSPYQRPVLALVDPGLCVTMPPKVTASTGMDALGHAIEAYVTRKFDRKAKPETPEKRPVYGGSNPFTDIIALKAVELVSNNLRRACNNGEDLDARWGMSMGSMLAGIAFTNSGLGLVHAMAMNIGGKFPIPHGEAVATLLPAVMEYNVSSDFDKFADIARVMGENIEGLGKSEAAMMAANAVKKIAADVGIPTDLKEFGVKKEDIPLLAEDTLKLQRLLVGNPRRVNRKEQVEEILKNLL